MSLTSLIKIFAGNTRRPELTQINLVDIFLFRADSQEQILHFPNQTNPFNQAGLLHTQVNDTWFGADGLKWSGSNLSFPYYWVITRSDHALDGSQINQPIFTAVQTTVLDSVASSSSAAAAASASSSSARAASLSSSSLSSAIASSSGNVQRDSSSSSFPHWAIAVIVVLGFLAIAASCILVFFILRRLRRRRERDSNRNSMGSASPMLARDNNNQDMIQTYDSPQLPPHTGIQSSATGISPLIPSRNLTTDAASTTSESGGPLSGADAAIIAEAFRKKLRKPDFAAPSVHEGDSPDTTGEHETEAAEKVVLKRELAEEGRDIRVVSSSRGVKVESQS
jgi:hypothetical protein